MTEGLIIKQEFHKFVAKEGITAFELAKVLELTEDEMHDLIVKGKVTIKCGLKLDASTNFDWERQGKTLQALRCEHILLEDYKQRVEKAIIKIMMIARSCTKPNKENISYSSEAIIDLINQMFKKELGLEQ